MTPVNQRSVKCYGENTSVTLEQEFWDLFCDLARKRGVSRTQLFEEFWRTCPVDSTMSSHIRTSMLKMVQEKART